MHSYVTHRRATFDFEILDTFEAGISLLGTEVKSIRNGRGTLEGGYVIIRGGEAFLVGVSIPAYQVTQTNKGYDPERPRKLLLQKKELSQLYEASEKRGLTVVPIKLYNKNQHIKLLVGIARGKKKYDKREVLKERDTKRSIEREIKRWT